AFTAQGVVDAVARRRVGRLYRPLRQALATGEAAGRKARARYKKDHARALRDAAARHKRNLARARARQRRAEEAARRAAAELAELERRFEAQRRDVEQRRDDDLLAAERRHAQGQARLLWEAEGGRVQLEAQHRARLDEITTRHQREWQALTERWRCEDDAVRRGLAELTAGSDEESPGWQAVTRDDWRPP